MLRSFSNLARTYSAESTSTRFAIKQVISLNPLHKLIRVTKLKGNATHRSSKLHTVAKLDRYKNRFAQTGMPTQALLTFQARAVAPNR